MADSAIGSSFDIVNRYQSQTSGTEFDPTVNRTQAEKEYKEKYEDKTSLDFEDMLSLMVAQFQNQTMDNQASTADMMNQLVQMTSMQAMTDMVSQMKDLTTANVLSYSASLVGQYVTVGVYDDEGELHEIYDKVEAAGTYDGQPVIFLSGKSYAISSIMAVGKLPERVDKDENGEDVEPWTDPDEENKDEENKDGTKTTKEVG